jgi:hypothetical protein
MILSEHTIRKKWMNGEESEITITVRRAQGEKCERCWNFSIETGVHDYWPTWKICPRCVGTLLEMKVPPFIFRSGQPGDPDADYYICADEKEWHDIMSGQKPLPQGVI